MERWRLRMWSVWRPTCGADLISQNAAPVWAQHTRNPALPTPAAVCSFFHCCENNKPKMVLCHFNLHSINYWRTGIQKEDRCVTEKGRWRAAESRRATSQRWSQCPGSDLTFAGAQGGQEGGTQLTPTPAWDCVTRSCQRSSEYCSSKRSLCVFC